MSFFNKRRKHPAVDSTSIGSILKQMGLIDDRVLTRAVEALEQNKDLMLGEVLVQMDYCSEEDLELALTRQKVMRGKLSHADAMNIVSHAIKKSKGVLKGLDELGALARTAAKNGGRQGC